MSPRLILSLGLLLLLPLALLQQDARSHTGKEWRAHIDTRLASRSYHIASHEAGYLAVNARHALMGRFSADGLVLSSRRASWQWGLQLSRYGYAGAMQPRPPMSGHGQQGRLEYRSPQLTEWYVNSPAGLEQGFTLMQAPTERPHAGGLRLELALKGSLQARLQDGELALHGKDGRKVLHYGKLQAWDAKHQTLPSRMELSEDGMTLALVVDDSSSTYPIVIDPVVTAADWMVESNQATAHMALVATAGDVNGDGNPDILVGVPGFDNGEMDEGKVQLYLGSPGGPALTPAWEFETNSAGASISAINTAGDVNGDGYDDVIVGSLGYGNGMGAAFLFYGSARGLSSTPDWQVESTISGANFGHHAGTAGDINGDGYDDVLVSTPGWSQNGSVYIYYGSMSGLSLVADLVLEGDLLFGEGASAAGDVNGDGYDDVIIGGRLTPSSPNGAYLYLGSTAGLQPVPVWQKEGDAGNGEPLLRFGASVAGVGDVNGDGYDDVVIGDPYHPDYPNNYQGRAYLYYGTPTGLSDAPLWQWEPDASQVNAAFGIPVMPAGDVNGDGYADIMIAAPFYDNGEADEGAAFVFHGSANGLSASPEWLVETDQAGAIVGYGPGDAIAPAGDMNGDGYDDVLVGSPLYDHGETDEGAAFLFYGSSQGLPGGLNTPPAEADLAVNLTAGPITLGSVFDYTVTVSNNGPDAAQAPVLTLTLPATVAFNSAPANCSDNAGTVTCVLADLNAGAFEQYSIGVMALSGGNYTAYASVSSDTLDPDAANNGATRTDLVNTPPVAQGLNLALAEDTRVDVNLAGSDADGDPLTYKVETQPQNGLLIYAVPNLVYVPYANFYGSDSFTYSVSDGQATATATVNLTITPVNDGPSMKAQNLVTDEDVALAITLDATDVDGDSLSYTLNTAPQHGVLSGTAPNLVYTPAANYYGSDSFTVSVSDGSLVTTGVVQLTVNPVNDAPEAQSQALQLQEDGSIAITLVATDVDGDALSYTTSTPGNGVLSGTAPNLVYTPQADFYGLDQFSFVVSDGALSASAVVNLEVLAVNDAPQAQDLALVTDEGQSVSFTLAGSDVDGDALSFALLSNPAHGQLSGSGAQLTYTPAPGYSGPDSFDYVANDGQLDSATATVSITVVAVNSAPLISGTPKAVAKIGRRYRFQPLASDADGDALSFSIENQPAWTRFDPASGRLSGRPTGRDRGVYRNIIISVTDGVATTALPAFDLTVRGRPDGHEHGHDKGHGDDKEHDGKEGYRKKEHHRAGHESGQSREHKERRSHG